MSGKLLNLINLTIGIVATMLRDSAFNEMQLYFLRCIADAARKLLQMLSSLPDVSIERVQHALDYESRSHLNVIIGYCDALLDEDEGALAEGQRKQLDILKQRSYELLTQLTEISA